MHKTQKYEPTDALASAHRSNAAIDIGTINACSEMQLTNAADSKRLREVLGDNVQSNASLTPASQLAGEPVDGRLWFADK